MGHLALAIDEDPDDRPSSVVGAIRYLRGEHEVSTVALVGAGSGAEAVVKANAETDEAVAGTMTLSAAGGADRASELQGRSVFVVATGDDEGFVQTAQELHENAPEPKELVEYAGSAHGQGLSRLRPWRRPPRPVRGVPHRGLRAVVHRSGSATASSRSAP